MSKLNVSQRVPASYDPHAIADRLRAIEDQVNRLAEGRISARHAAASAAPTAGPWAQGDVGWNSAPAAEGCLGWVCVTGGAPGTWKGGGAGEA